ncbi:MAG TPA: hypothetical protein VG270_06735 [Pseudolabrys sp.]|jgi:hypothetical protein|nr:hypothetical protein [Pseudolabrys sp.]
MTDDPKAKNAPQKSGREQRLAAALRENLRRRKAQVRGRRAGKRPDVEEDREPETGSKR